MITQVERRKVRRLNRNEMQYLEHYGCYLVVHYAPDAGRCGTVKCNEAFYYNPLTNTLHSKTDLYREITCPACKSNLCIIEG